MSIIWYVIWETFSYESPAVHPTITEKERNFIEQSIGDENVEVSWKRNSNLCTTLLCSAVVVASVASDTSDTSDASVVVLVVLVAVVVTVVLLLRTYRSTKSISTMQSSKQINSSCKKKRMNNFYSPDYSQHCRRSAYNLSRTIITS